MQSQNALSWSRWFRAGLALLVLATSACASQPEKADGKGAGADTESDIPYAESGYRDSILFEEAMYGLPQGPWEIVFADGSGNVYRFTGDGLSSLQVVYEPVKPAHSSSGTYDGGEPFESQLTAAQAARAWELVRDYARQGDAHIERRVMGSGRFEADSKAESYEFILPNGEELRQFVSFVDDLESQPMNAR